MKKKEENVNEYLEKIRANALERIYRGMDEIEEELGEECNLRKAIRTYMEFTNSRG